jgi:MFS family permease
MSSFVGAVVAAARPYRVFIATRAGWMQGGFDSAIYIYVIVPALTEWLPKSDFMADSPHIAWLGSLMFSLFMLGWACSMFWGWCANSFGRLPTMCATILIYSIFTGACGLASGMVSFATFCFLTGFGIGGEWAAGAPLLQESVPEHLTCLIFGLWSSTFWIPTLVINGQRVGGASVADAQYLGSLSGLILSVGTLAGCVAMPWIVGWIPRRKPVTSVFFCGAPICNIASYFGMVVLLKICRFSRSCYRCLVFSRAAYFPC